MRVCLPTRASHAGYFQGFNHELDANAVVLRLTELNTKMDGIAAPPVHGVGNHDHQTMAYRLAELRELRAFPQLATYLHIAVYVHVVYTVVMLHRVPPAVFFSDHH
jgi:hypothetical protein